MCSDLISGTIQIVRIFSVHVIDLDEVNVNEIIFIEKLISLNPFISHTTEASGQKNDETYQYTLSLVSFSMVFNQVPVSVKPS